jgi:hypothetical protein
MKYFVVAEQLVFDESVYNWLKKHAQLIEKGSIDKKDGPKKPKSVKDCRFKLDDLFNQSK